MLNQLMDLIQSHSQKAIVNNPAIPDQHKNDVMQTIAQSVMDGLQKKALLDVPSKRSPIGTMMPSASQNALGRSSDNDSFVLSYTISQNATRELIEKFGLSNSEASNIVSQVIPDVLNLMSARNGISDDKYGSLLSREQPQQTDQANIHVDSTGPDSNYSFSDGLYTGDVKVTKW